ncbi:hypothetical protein [Streptomyces flaveus]|uniref:hypothetical protein n=1 Tax=Streptomyces flaveus TaxID=66370 RepID=UPI00332BEC05
MKVIRAEHAQDAGFRRRFAREVRAASQVAGYHLLPILDFDLDGPQPWMVTAYKPGLSLQDLLTAHGPLPPNDRTTTTSPANGGAVQPHARGDSPRR